MDFLSRSGQRYWQILPLNPTGDGNSPYSSCSVFAGNPLFVDPRLLAEQGLLAHKDLADMQKPCTRRVDYESVALCQLDMLRRAAGNFSFEEGQYLQFCEENAKWLEDFALYAAIKEQRKKSWMDWPEPLRMRQPQAIAQARAEQKEEMDFWKFTQYCFFKQWDALRSYAGEKGIRIIGDMPIYAALDSADVWAGEDQFQLDERRNPTAVAGVPPDYFSQDGQLWGNPLYDWEKMRKDGYSWWLRRTAQAASLYDVTRIDHFRAFDEYYAIPSGEATAKNGSWKPGPGMELFEAIRSHLGPVEIIAEDLGLLTPSVRRLLRETGFPGMKVLQFAFDGGYDNDYLPHNFRDGNCVVYTGTHDNDTACGWYHSAGAKTIRFAKRYLGRDHWNQPNWKLIRAALHSRAKWAIIPMQDWLGLDAKARMNIPSTVGENWRWRMLPGEDGESLAFQIYRQLRSSHRLRIPQEEK